VFVLWDNLPQRLKKTVHRSQTAPVWASEKGRICFLMPEKQMFVLGCGDFQQVVIAVHFHFPYTDNSAITLTTVRNLRSWLSSPAAPAHATVFFALVLVGSLPVSPFVLSLGMWGLVFTAFWQQFRADRGVWGSRRWWRVLARSFEHLFRNRALAVLTLLLLVPVLSGLWSEDTGYWLERVRVRLPFLVLPWAFANLPVLHERHTKLVLYGSVWIAAGICLGVGINYWLHQEAILEAMQQGRPMPVPRNHIRFSLLVATAVLAGAWLWQQRFVWRWAWERWALAAAVGFLFVFLHILAVRSGIAALYAALLFVAVRWAWRFRRWAPALALVLASGLALWGALRVFPSLHQKWAYTVYDWERYQAQSGASYSDSERWISMRAGWLLWQAHPWLGVGAGDLRAETARVVAEHFPEYQADPKLPHNQFLYLLAGTGLVGLAISLFALLVPVFAYRGGGFLFGAFQVTVCTSFLVEYTLETAMGVAWYLFFTLWLLRPAQHA